MINNYYFKPIKDAYKNKYGEIENDKMFDFFLNDYSHNFSINNTKINDIIEYLHQEIEINKDMIKIKIRQYLIDEIKRRYNIEFNQNDIRDTLDEVVNDIFKKIILKAYFFDIKCDIKIDEISNLKEIQNEAIYTILIKHTKIEDYNFSAVTATILKKNKFEPSVVYSNPLYFINKLNDICFYKKKLIDEILNKYNLKDIFLENKINKILNGNYTKLKLSEKPIVNDPNGSKIIVDKHLKKFFIAVTTDAYLENNNLIEPKIALIIDEKGNIYDYNKVSSDMVFNSLEETNIYLSRELTNLIINQEENVINIKNALRSYLLNIGCCSISGIISLLILKYLINNEIKPGIIIGINIGIILSNEIRNHIFKEKKFIIPSLIRIIRYNKKRKKICKIGEELNSSQIDTSDIGKMIEQLIDNNQVNINNLKTLKNYITNDLICDILNSEKNNDEKKLLLS